MARRFSHMSMLISTAATTTPSMVGQRLFFQPLKGGIAIGRLSVEIFDGVSFHLILSVSTKVIKDNTQLLDVKG